PLLEQAAQVAPDDPMLRSTLLQAQIGAAFDAKNYQTMVEHAERLFATNPTNDDMKFMLASAEACVYASTGDKAALRKAIDLLPKPADIDAYKPEQRKYFNRIEHRLLTHEIINRAEFERRFPEGWKPEVAAK
ncbi:MAG TPA: hypothetical protein VG713_16585, partial [Pirellulales bacterium]|nr:hypothetical protein [Pirellulales bacterium]